MLEFKAGEIMATNFRITMNRTKDSLHLTLMGDFDVASAHELRDVLKRNLKGVYRVILDADSLKNIYRTGRETFRSSLSSLNAYPIHIEFTGENAERIVPERILFLNLHIPNLKKRIM